MLLAANFKIVFILSIDERERKFHNLLEYININVFNITWNDTKGSQYSKSTVLYAESHCLGFRITRENLNFFVIKKNISIYV